MSTTTHTSTTSQTGSAIHPPTGAEREREAREQGAREAREGIKQEEKKQPLVKPYPPKARKPLDINVVGADAVFLAEEEEREIREAYEKAQKEYESELERREKAEADRDKAEPKLGKDATTDAIHTALDNLYNVVHVPDQATIEQTVNTACGGVTPATEPAGTVGAREAAREKEASKEKEKERERETGGKTGTSTTKTT